MQSAEKSSIAIKHIKFETERNLYETLRKKSSMTTLYCLKEYSKGCTCLK